MTLTLSQQYNSLPKYQRWPIEETILNQIETMMAGWKKVASQHAGSKVDLLTSEGKNVQHTTQYKLPETGNAFLEQAKWQESKNINEIWSFGVPDALDHITTLWVVNRDVIETAIQTQQFKVIGTHKDPNKLGYLIPTIWLDFHASIKI